MNKPPTLPEQSTPDDTEPKKPRSLPEPSIAKEDTQPTPTQQKTQPKNPGVIPPPPSVSAKPNVIKRRIRRRNKRGGWWATLGVLLLLSLVVGLISFVILLIYTPEYFDPYIPGRLATRTTEAQIAQATANTFSTREAALIATQQQAANNAAATGTAIVNDSNQRATQSALNAQGTANALVQTSTGAALAFDATRTAVAVDAQRTSAASTLDAVQFQFTQTSAARLAQATSAARTLQAPPQAIVQSQGSEPERAPVPNIDTSRFNLLFVDEFEVILDPAWRVNGEWRVSDGAAFSNICGTSLLVGSADWQRFAIDLSVNNPQAQFAVLAGYGDGGRLFINFGLGGSVWWLVDGEAAITDETATNVYTPSTANDIRIIADERVVSVFVDGELATERLLPKTVQGMVGLYTCPANGNVPRFNNFRVARLP